MGGSLARRRFGVGAAFVLAGALGACGAAGEGVAPSGSGDATVVPSVTVGTPDLPTAATPRPERTPTAVPPTSVATEPPPPAELNHGDQARADLVALREVPRRHTGEPYRRDAFGGRWVDLDGNGCNQRDDVLLRDAVPGTVLVQWQGACDHDVLAGTWLDPYTGATMEFTDLKEDSQARAIQIDHIVPLAEAWISGADEWSAARRELFANDLTVLLAVDGPTNSAKGAADPAAWRPKKSFQCEYAIRWIGIKAAWDLGADVNEKRALEEMLDYCA